ncbi:hypothetical protein AVEN_243586-1 [Araneus ventricosus]|uniref:Uncharacterized protein n=1 Tax=Araneus ventricosus TaxID=182803 RepID=A0A4Y2A585_ARAVE|nr:hypothetical protein AVEN_243586-1 [Araneus ventricosus]
MKANFHLSPYQLLSGTTGTFSTFMKTSGHSKSRHLTAAYLKQMLGNVLSRMVALSLWRRSDSIYLMVLFFSNYHLEKFSFCTSPSEGFPSTRNHTMGETKLFRYAHPIIPFLHLTYHSSLRNVFKMISSIHAELKI